MTGSPADPRGFKIAIVGPCASGKSTLEQGLQDLGYDAHAVVQEHSYVPDMWSRLTQPDFLIYLKASYETCSERKTLNWSREEFEVQESRLSHAREHCDLLVDTEAMSPEEVLATAREAIQSRPAAQAEV